VQLQELRYVHNGWKKVIQEAAKLYYAQTGKEQSSRKGTTISQRRIEKFFPF